MHKFLSSFSLSLFAAISLQAQTPFNTMDSINVNNINASVLVHGDMWWDPVALIPKCEFPQGSGKHINFMSSLWMSGYDGGGQLHTAAQTYRQNGNDYWPGPLDSNDTLTYATSHDWAKIWKVYRADIQLFQSQSTHTVANTPAGILTWPAAGNTYATGNGGTALTISSTAAMAPFIDVNSNGVYEPLLGDYPNIKGDEALWWVFSDNGPTHTQTHGKPIGLEIHAMCYGYGRGTLIDNVVYYEYTVTNKSANNYSNFRISQFSDADLGFYNDDYIGFDSVHRMGIIYNGTNDDGAAAGHPVNSYGLHAPVSGVSMIVLPGDAGTTKVPVGSFDYYNNDFSVLGNPSDDTQCNNYIRGLTRVGAPFTNPSGAAVNYVYPGDPSGTAQWSECSAGDMPGDRRFIISSNDFSLAAGETKVLVMALVTTDTNQGGCPVAGFHDIKVVADTAWNVFVNPPPPIPAAVNNINLTNGTITIYPNPATNQLNIEAPGGSPVDAAITIYNTVGQVMNVPISTSQKVLVADVKLMPPGVYYLLYKNANTQQAVRFVKE